ncbi:MAG: hypothetical protein FWH08_00515 [Oscillospiraceae bacterium]|nr:hypothetical protein [Oscillospiraceae bacterium]
MEHKPSVEEYKILNEKIITRTKTSHSTWNFTYTTIVAVLAFAIKADTAWLFLLSYFITIPVMLIQLHQILGIWKIQAYMIVFYKDTEFIFEDLRIDFDKEHRKNKKISNLARVRGFSTLPYIVLSVIPIIFISVYFFERKQLTGEYNVILCALLGFAIALLVATIIIWIKIFRVDDMKGTYREIWESVKKKKGI